MSGSTRNQRRHAAKMVRRDAKKAARAALHGLPRLEAPPSLLQATRTAVSIRKTHAEVEKLLGSPAS